MSTDRRFTDQRFTDQLSTTFAALADPTRRAILAHLAKGEASVTELAQPFQVMNSTKALSSLCRRSPQARRNGRSCRLELQL